MRQAIGDVLRAAQHCLEHHGVDEPRASAEVLLADLLSIPRLTLSLDAHLMLSSQQSDAYAGRIQRRLAGEPVQYITGVQEFWSLEFHVDRRVLIPRPETELLVEYGLNFARQWGARALPLRILDVGTGSGNLAISLAHALPESLVWGLDRSLQALEVARENARRHGVENRVTWCGSDLVTALQAGRFQAALCVSNLPYVTGAEWESLPRHIKDYEPAMALCGGEDGLEVIRRLIAMAPAVLAPSGAVLLEVGWQQGAAVRELLKQQGDYQAVGVYQDFSGVDRVVWAQRGET